MGLAETLPGVVCEKATEWLAAMLWRASNALDSFFSMISSYTSGWKRSFDYSGRATRADYWWFVLANLIVYVILLVITTALAVALPDNPTPARVFESLTGLYIFAQIIPSLALCVRRMHDIGKQWYWIFISLVPCIGGFWFLYLTIQPSVVG